MKSYHHIESVRSTLAKVRKEGLSIGFVPTMGNLHDAHIALVNIAKQRADYVVTSIFVNRLQFGLNEDWDKYPRTLESDTEKLKAAGCDMLFCPEEQEIYPNGMDEQTRVIAPSMSDILCGSSRPGHFEGVTTVVTKLFNIVQPDIAVFGVKDYQQLAIIRRMVEDLCIPVDIIAGDIVRESDGLAMSSRNSFIAADERPRANALYAALNGVLNQLREGKRHFSALEADARSQIEKSGFRPDYISIRNSKTLELAANDDSQLTVLGAMYTKSARLIDNVSIDLKSDSVTSNTTHNAID